MIKPSNHSDPSDAAQDHPTLRAALTELYQGRGDAEMTDAADQATRQAIRAHFAVVSRKKGWGRFAAPWAAVAATLLLAGAIGWLALRTSPERMQPAAARVPADIDADGTVNMIDALVLADRLQVGHPIDPGLDLNHDGKVDRADVDVIAMKAVSLVKETAG
jgi:hypothetical protein